MSKFIVELHLDGYTDFVNMESACKQYIYEALNASGSSVHIEEFYGYQKKLDSEMASNHRLIARNLELENSITAATARADAATWQPIETAPMDGRTVLLGLTNSHGKWRTMRGQWCKREDVDSEWYESESCDEGWYETSVEADDIPNMWSTSPTHWMPLPKPPEQTP